MDFPKSVPSAGLVDGKFIDEDALTGTPGSLIPSAWGNAITLEVLNVIEAGDLDPDEDDNSQLLQAIGLLVGRALPVEATAVVLGLVKQASKAEAEDGTDDKKSMSALRVHQAIAKKAPAPAVVVSTAASKVLLAADLGLVLVDSTAAATTITLPASNAALGIRDVIIRRVDNSGNRLTVTAAGTDKVKFHTHLRAEGYPFFVLMGAGDWWHLRSDGVGNWWPVGRYDNTPLGRPDLETTTAISPGGWGLYHGLVYNRAEWPWTWDHAQASGMLTTEALRAGNEGCWTSGDGALTFRSPEGRGEFARYLDEGRGVDAGRTAGSWQKGTLVGMDNDSGGGSEALSWGVTNGPPESVGGDKFSLVSSKYPGLLLRASSLATGITPSDTFFSIARPRNMANPGRIKMI